jgi:hypothetical protein
MVEDLKKQASQIYREQSSLASLPTSESLSMKRLFYLAAGIAVLALLAIQIFGGFKRRPDPIAAAVTPPPLVKEAPPPELLQPETAAETQTRPEKGAASESDAGRPAPAQETPVAAKPAVPPRNEAPAPPAGSARSQTGKPVLRREPSAAAPIAAKETQAQAAPARPEIPPEEMARREAARELVIRQKPALAELLLAAKKYQWQAQPEKEGIYLVTFTISDEAGGNGREYVWKVDLNSRSVSPLSYYARALP